NRGPVSLRLAKRFPRRCVVCRHVGVAVRALEARVLPRAAAAAYVVAVLRRALPDGRGQQHVLQPACDVGVRALVSTDAGRLRLCLEDEPLAIAPYTAARPDQAVGALASAA